MFVDANIVCNHYTEEFGPIEQFSDDDVVPPTCGARSHDLATCARNVKALYCLSHKLVLPRSESFLADGGDLMQRKVQRDSTKRCRSSRGHTRDEVVTHAFGSEAEEDLIAKLLPAHLSARFTATTLPLITCSGPYPSTECSRKLGSITEARGKEKNTQDGCR